MSMRRNLIRVAFCTLIPLALSAQAPTIGFVLPSSFPVGTSAREMAVEGTGFTASSVVMWNGQSLSTTVLPTHLIAVVPSVLIAALGVADVTVVDPGPLGGTSAPYRVTVDPVDAGGGMTVVGTAIGAHFGWTVDHLGDTNADGRGDFVVGALDGTRVFSGSNGAVLLTVPAVGPVTGLGDTNGDGCPDFAVGTPGITLVMCGATGILLRSIAWSGAVDGREDFDGDGVRDLVIGGFNQARIYGGANGALLWLRQGDRPQDEFGASVAALHDLDGDALPDVLVGAALAGPTEDGLVRAYSFATGMVIATIAESAWRVASAGDMNGDLRDEVLFERIGEVVIRYSNGLVQWGFDDGAGMAAIGDVNGDQLSDIGIGIDGALEQVLVIRGAAMPPTVVPESLGCPARNGFGRALAGRGDVTGDGKPDLLIGAPQPAGGSSPAGAGFVRVVSFPAARGMSIGGACTPMGSPGGATLLATPPGLGASLAIQLRTALPNSHLIAGFQSPFPAGGFPVGSGCELLVSPASAVLLPGMTDAQGLWSLAIALPASTTLLGANARVQVALVGLAAPAGLAISNAVDLRLGY